MLTLEELRIAFRAELRDDASFLTPTEVETHIESAIRSVNLDKPLRKPSDIPGDDSTDYPLPSTYVNGYSVIDFVEYPIEDPPKYLLPEEDWFVYEDPTKPAGEQMRLRFRLSNPATGKVIRVLHTAFYTVTEDESNLDPYAFEAVLALSLHKAYVALAGKYSQSTDPTILADAVNYGNKVQTFLLLAGQARQEYNRRTGLGSPVKAAQYLTEVDVMWAHGEDFVWHPRILR